MYKCIYLIILFFNINTAFALPVQKTQIDSLINKLHELPEDTIKVNTLISITDKLNEKNCNKAIYYGEKALNLAKKLNHNTGITRAYHHLAITYYYKADYKEAMILYLEKMKLDEQKNNKLNIANNYNFIGNIYFQVKDFNKAFENYKKSLKIYQELNNKEGLSFMYNNLGNIYEAFKKPEKSEENYLRSLKLDKQTNSYKGLAITYNNLGNLYYKQYNDTTAIDYFHKAVKYLPVVNDPNTTVLLFQNIGDYYIWNKNYDSAFFYLNKAYIIAKNYERPFFIKDISLSLSKVHEIHKNFQKAYEFQTIYNHLNDSIFKLNNSAKINLLEFQYDQEKNEIEQNFLYFKQQRKTKTIVWLSSIIFLIAVVIAIIYIIYQKGKIKENNLTKEKIKIETTLLQEQLEYRNKEIVIMTMNLLERNKLINQVINKLQSILPNTKRTNCCELENIIKELKSNYHENILNEFEIRFNKVHIDFFKNIKQDFDNVTSNELRLCAFLKMNMSTKDIASLTHQTLNSIEVARTRLRKKLNLNNTETDIVNFLACY